MSQRCTLGTDIDAASNALITGGIIAYPTEGVFGLGCDPNNDAAIESLLALKKRDADRGLILIAANINQLSRYLTPLSKETLDKLEQTWPGPVTWILPCNTSVSDLVSGGRDTIAARVTAHESASQLCKTFNSALISTSANLSGEPAYVDAIAVQSAFGNQLAYVLNLPVGTLQGPTPIYDGLTGNKLR